MFFLGHLAFSCDIGAAKLPAACGDQPTFGLNLIESLDNDLSLESRRALSRRMAAPSLRCLVITLAHALAEVTWPLFGKMSCRSRATACAMPTRRRINWA
jgi:hypothetical protein